MIAEGTVTAQVFKVPLADWNKEQFMNHEWLEANGQEMWLETNGQVEDVEDD